MAKALDDSLKEAEATAVLARKRKLNEVDVTLDVPLGMDAVLGADGSWWGDGDEDDDLKEVERRRKPKQSDHSGS